METYWRKTVTETPHSMLESDLQADAAVIGGGIAGVLTAALLQERGLDVVLLEADRLGAGQSEKTTAKVTAQHGLCYTRIQKTIGRDAARIYARLNQQAVEGYEALIQRQGIDCDWRRAESCLYACRDAATLEEEAAAARQAGLEMTVNRKSELPFPIAGALWLRNQGAFHPLKLLEGLANKLRVYTKTPVQQVRPGEVRTPGGTVRAKWIVIATHYPMTRWRGGCFLRMHQERSHVAALTGVPAMQGLYLGIEPEAPWSFRPVKNGVLLGGAGFRTGMLQKENQRRETLTQQAGRWWPGCTVEAAWAAQDCMTLDGLPLAGYLSRGETRILTATGFQKWGMTGAMAAARILVDDITGGNAKKGALFTPQRVNLRASALPFLKEMGFSALQLMAGVVCPPRCSHLGCRLCWNAAERTWDCPCHGSRFMPGGEVLDGPAQKRPKMINR